MTSKALCWIDDSIIPADQASVSVFDHGLLYGDGVFEGLRFYHGTTFMLERTSSDWNNRQRLSGWYCHAVVNR